MFWLVLVGIAYFYFHWQYFRLVRNVEEITSVRMEQVLPTYLINYLYFTCCSMFELPLMFNWLLFAVLLFGETVLYNGKKTRSALFTTLIGIIFGLSVTIFCRSMVSILLNQPLYSFNNHITAVNNMKRIPVCLGFLLSGIWIQNFINGSVKNRICVIFKYPNHQIFLMQMMAGMFIYLFINLLLYSTPLNDIILKIWSIKSCLFCVSGFYISIQYTKRICELEEYREKNHEIEEELFQRRQKETFLRRKASLDALTGLYNRRYAEELIDSLMEEQQSFVLCFLDLDHLKQVNDQYGHKEGDHYIRTVTDHVLHACRSGTDMLFRYGGDEFLVLFMDTTEDKAGERMELVLQKLGDFADREKISYAMSFSYGLAESGSYSTWAQLIQAADQKMYQKKQKKSGGEKT